MAIPVVRVGVASLITSATQPGCVLIGQRKSSHGFNKYAFPGGHLEIGESWAECALRETKEETNLDVAEAKCLLVTNDIAMGGDPGKHYITIIMHSVMDPASAPLENCEPDKCAGWEWVSWAELQEKVSVDDS
ncbi:unnamed protein product, partial [Ectocarpus fasciculatus]